MSSNQQKVLVGCEFSQVVTKAFRDKGIEAYSCDLLPCEINPDWHLQMDVFEAVKQVKPTLGIFHPPCTYLCVSGLRWLYDKDPKFANRKQQQLEAIKFVKDLWKLPIQRICIENPIGVLSSYWKEPTQIIQPFWFGENAQKATCLWLKNLPVLKPTNMINPEIVTLSSGKRMSKWYYETSRKCPERAKIRSRTFQGVADAMVTQWGNYKPLQLELSECGIG
jgi:hypothetical protein